MKLLKSAIVRWGVMILLFYGLNVATGQINPVENRIYLIGQVVNTINGAPIENQELIITSDSTNEANFPYYKKVYTDKEGYYYDTIFAPNQKGSLSISTFDYLNDLHDTTVYYRFNWSENNILFAHFKLPVEPITNIFQANFYFLKNPDGENYLDYQFYDISNSEDIISWYWDFGDGTISNEQHPMHTFSEPGLYRVQLTVIIFISNLVKPIETNIVKIINVAPKSYFHIGGHVFANYFPIDIGEVYLYKIEESEVEPIDTAIFSGEYGFYIFPQVIEGEYFVKADLNYTSEYYNQFLSTYYSNKLHWKEADTIFNFATNWEYDISLVPNSKMMYGPGKVSGNVTFDIDTKDPIGPACYVEIILYDTENHLVDVCHSDKYGNFELNTLDLQMYNVYAEVTGKHTIPLQVELDESLFEITQINITIGDYSVNGSFSLGIGDKIFSNSVSQVYPNPATDRIYIDINPQIKNDLFYLVTDQQGRSIKSGTISPDNFYGYLIDVNTLKPGLYFIRIEGNTHHTTRRFIKQ